MDPPFISSNLFALPGNGGLGEDHEYFNDDDLAALAHVGIPSAQATTTQGLPHSVSPLTMAQHQTSSSSSPFMAFPSTIPPGAAGSSSITSSATGFGTFPGSQQLPGNHQNNHQQPRPRHSFSQGHSQAGSFPAQSPSQSQLQSNHPHVYQGAQPHPQDYNHHPAMPQASYLNRSAHPLFYQRQLLQQQQQHQQPQHQVRLPSGQHQQQQGLFSPPFASHQAQPPSQGNTTHYQHSSSRFANGANGPSSSHPPASSPPFLPPHHAQQAYGFPPSSSQQYHQQPQHMFPHQQQPQQLPYGNPLHSTMSPPLDMTASSPFHYLQHHQQLQRIPQPSTVPSGAVVNQPVGGNLALEQASKGNRKSSKQNQQGRGRRGADESDEEDEEWHGKQIDLAVVGQRKSSRLRTRQVSPPPFQPATEHQPFLPIVPSQAPVTSSKYEQPLAQDEGEAHYAEDANPKRFEVESILQTAKRKKSEWNELMKKMNTSKVTDGSRLRFEGNPAFAPTAEGGGSNMNGTGNPDSQTDEHQSLNQAETSGASESEQTAGLTATNSVEDNTSADPMEERFLIKWRDASYLHTSWETEADLCTKLVADYASSRMEPRCRRARAQPPGPYADRGGFNPEMKQVDRVLDAVTIEGSEEPLLLIKWRHLGYDEATWESKSDLLACGVNFAPELERFHRRQTQTQALAGIPLAQRQRMLLVRDVIPHLAESPEYKNGLHLRPYQLEALNWLTFNWCQQRNSILADEMGLGKTAQSIAFGNAVARGRGPILVVAPLATLPHWEREFEAWTDLNVIMFRGNVMSREVCKQREFFVDERQDWFKFDVLLTNYETVLQEEEVLARCPWALLIVDEAHRLKNRKSKLTSLLRDRLRYSACLLLTGTPIQNDTGELWTLLNFVDRHAFPSYDAFVQRYGSITTARDMDDFHGILKPYLLRRFKSDVEANLPPKEEVIIEVELTELQKYYYRSVYEQNVQTLLRGVIPGTRLNLNNVAMQLRKCCNHPYLIDGVEAKALQDHEVAMASGQAPPEFEGKTPQERVMTLLIQASGKLILLDKLLPKLKQQNHRVLIFSQFVRLLDILEDYLRYRAYGYERIDGSVTATKRQEAIDRFSAPDSSSLVFLLSTRGCGQGINLISADTVILFDSDWNPQNDVQAQARCHRIGQTKPVSVYRLITRKTYEQEMFSRASLKLGLDEAVASKLQQQADDGAQGGGGNDDESKLAQGVSDQELELMLKFGAYALSTDASADAATTRAFCEADIDEILSTRATRIQARQGGSSGTASTIDGPGGSRFSKATFVSKSSGEVEMDDPEFWSKVLGKDVAMTAGEDEEATMGKRRRRRGGRVIYGEDGVIARANDNDEDDEEFQPPVPFGASSSGTRSRTRAERREHRRQQQEGPDSPDGDFEEPLDDRATAGGLSMTSTKNLVGGLITFALGRYAEIRKRVGSHLSEEDCARFGLGIALICCVWRSKEDRTGELPFPQLETDEDVVNTCKLLAQVVASEAFIVDKYDGPIRKSFLARLKRELKLHEFEVTRSMLDLKRFKMRSRETLNMFADAVDVDDFITSDPPKTVPLARGAPPAKGWLPADDRAVLQSFYKYGFERRRRPETWRQMFADKDLNWSQAWKPGDDFDGEAAEADDDDEDEGARKKRRQGTMDEDGGDSATAVVDMRRLLSRYTRIIAALHSPVNASGSNRGGESGAVAVSAAAQAAAAERVRKQQEADEGEVTPDWNDVEKERLVNLLLRWGLPPEATSSVHLSAALLGGSATPPKWEVFAQSLPRKTVNMIQEKTLNMIGGLREMVQAGNCPASRKGLLNRIDLLARLWNEVLPSFDTDDSFLIKIGHYFYGVQRQNKFMPTWWLPAHDMALFRAGCRYGMTGWNEALADRALFPEMPSSSPDELLSTASYPGTSDLTRRLVAVLEWLFLIADKAVPADVEVSTVRARGLQLMSPPTLEAMMAQVEDNNARKRLEEQAQEEAKQKLVAKEQAAMERARAKAEKAEAKKLAAEAAAAATLERKELKKQERARKRAEAAAAAAAAAESGEFSDSAKVASTRKRKSSKKKRRVIPSDDEDDDEDFVGHIPPPPPPSSESKQPRERRTKRSKMVMDVAEDAALMFVPPPSVMNVQGSDIPPPPPPQKPKKRGRKKKDRAIVVEMPSPENAASDTVAAESQKRKRGRPRKKPIENESEETPEAPKPPKARSATPRKKTKDQGVPDAVAGAAEEASIRLLAAGVMVPPPPPPVTSASPLSAARAVKKDTAGDAGLDDFVADALRSGAVPSHGDDEELIIF